MYDDADTVDPHPSDNPLDENPSPVVASIGGAWRRAVIIEEN
jgi:hypothetical protein